MPSPLASSTHQQHLLQFVEASSAAASSGDVIDLFRQALQQYGYDQVAILSCDLSSVAERESDCSSSDGVNEASIADLPLQEIAIPIYSPTGLSHAVLLRRSSVTSDDGAYLDICHVMAAQCHKICQELDSHPAPLTSDIELTDREKDILLWSSRGKSNSVIGDILGVTAHGVKFHMANIMKKLRVDSRVSATVKAIRYGLINP
jgi:DNA-binding CsgD family transcriptional regulator